MIAENKPSYTPCEYHSICECHDPDCTANFTDEAAYNNSKLKKCREDGDGPWGVYYLLSNLTFGNNTNNKDNANPRELEEKVIPILI